MAKNYGIEPHQVQFDCKAKVVMLTNLVDDEKNYAIQVCNKGKPYAYLVVDAEIKTFDYEWQAYQWLADYKKRYGM